MPDWTPLDSSNLDACAYEDGPGTLRIRFKSGRSYAYDGVSRETYDGLLSASSPGAYFNSSIKDRYPTR